MSQNQNETRFDKLPVQLGNFVLKYRWPIILFNFVVILIVMVGLMGRGQKFGEHVAYMENLRNDPLSEDTNHVSPAPIFNSDYHVFFQKDNQDLIAFDNFQRIFSKEDNLVLVVKSKSGDLFTNENLQALLELTEESWELPYVNRVEGLSNFSYTYADEDDLLVEDFIEELPLSSQELEAKKKLALSDPLMPHFLISKNADLTQITLTVVAPLDFPDAYAKAGSSAKELVQKYRDKFPDLDIKAGGTVMLNNAFEEYAMNDFQTLVPIMYGLIILFLCIVSIKFWGGTFQIILRAVLGTVLPMGLLLTSVLFPVALFVGWMDYSLTNVSMNVIQMLVAVAVADAVHIVVVFFRGLHQGLDKRQAVIFTLEKNLVACTITSVTTSIGFYSLLLQSMPPFRDLGLFAGTGTLYALVVSVFTLPAILSLFPLKANAKAVASENKGPSAGIKSFGSWVAKRQRVIRTVAVLLTAGSFYFITQINVDSTAVNYFDEGTEFRSATEYIDQNIIGTNPLEFNFDAGKESGVYDPEFLKKIERFKKHVEETEPNITYVSSIVDVVKRLNKTLHGDDDSYYRIPERDSVIAEGDTLYARNLVAQYMFLYNMSLPQGKDMTNQININRSQTRVTAFVKSLSSREQNKIVDRLNSWLEKEMPEVQARGIGVPVMFNRLMVVAIPGMLWSLGVSLFLITVVLMITFRSFKVGLFSMIPNVWPVLIIFGAVGLAGYIVNLSVAVVCMITLGICVDDTVHFLVKYLNAARKGISKEDAINEAIHQVGAPLLFTSLILVMGFGALGFSNFALNSDLGILCSMVIALALVADFILLPATILKFDKNRN